MRLQLSYSNISSTTQMYYYKRENWDLEAKQKGTGAQAHQKRIGRRTKISREASAHTRPGASQCLLHPYFDNHLGWKYNFIYVTCICNIDGQ